MRYLASSLCVVLAALPLAPAWAASPAPVAETTVPLSFAIAPGCQFKPGCAHARQLPQHDFTYVVAPGETVTDWVAVINPSKTAPLGVMLSVADGRTPPQGAGIAYPTGRQREVGNWIKLSASTVTVTPYYIQLVPLTVHIPASTPPGEYQGAIIGTSVREAVITQGKMRYAIHGSKRARVQLRVTGRATMGLSIAGASLTAPVTRAALSVTLRNTGTVVDHPIVTTITLAGPHKTYSLRPAIGPITAGAASTVTLPIGSAIAPGTYRLSVAISYRAQVTQGAQPRQSHATWTGAVVASRGVTP